MTEQQDTQDETEEPVLTLNDLVPTSDDVDTITRVRDALHRLAP